MSPSLMHNDLFRYGPKSLAEPVSTGVKQVLLGSDGRVVQSKSWYEQGAVIESGGNHQTRVCYVLDGFFEIQVGDKSQILGPSGSFFVPAGKAYCVTCLDDGELLEVFVPQNESAFHLENA